MAAAAWIFYNTAKKYMMNGTVQLGTTPLRLGLYTSASNASTQTLSTKAAVTNEVAEGVGYSSSGKALAGVTWTVGASASEYRLNANPLIWTATGGDIVNVKFAVLWASGGKAIAWSKLSTAAFTVTQGNTLTITPSANGIFEVN